MRVIDQSGYQLPPGVKKILLIQLGDIGDVVWTTPAIRAVKNCVPEAQVSVMVKEGFGGLLEADPSIKKVFELKRPRGNLLHQAAGQMSFLKSIRAQRFDLVIDLRLGDRGAFLSFLTGAPLRVTMHHPGGVPFWRQYFFTHGVVPRPRLGAYGAADQTLCFLRGIGIDTEDIIPGLWVADAVKNRVREILDRERVGAPARWITINFFSRWSYKEWDAHKWVEIINWLWRDFATPVIIIGSREEQPKAQAIIKKCDARVFNFAGLTSLSELAGLLSLSRLHVGVDSAAPHIAAATGVPTVTIYGPTSWKDWAPVGKVHRVIAPDMDCAPCFQKGCDNGGHSLCLESLSPEKVKGVIREALDAQERRLED